MIGKRVAIKVLNKELCEDPYSVERFLDEARVVNQIQNPNIVLVLPAPPEPPLDLGKAGVLIYLEVTEELFTALDDALFRPEVRKAYADLVKQGWTDGLRKLHPGERIYTFWDYFRNSFARDAGLRIDHLLLSPAVAKRLVAASVDRHVRAWEKSSDHAPVWIELKDSLLSQSRR